MSALRILMLTQFYPPVIGGEERHVRSLGMALVRRGHEVCVVTQGHPQQPSTAMDEGVRILRLPGTFQRQSALYSEADRPHMPPFPDPTFARRLAAVVREFRPDVVHAHNWVVYSFAPLKRAAGVPLVLTVHDYGVCCPKKNLMRDGSPCLGPTLPGCVRCAGQHYGGFKGTVTTLAHRVSTPLLPVDRYLTVSGAVARLNDLAGSGLPHEVVPNFIPDDLGASPEETPDERLGQLPAEPFLLFVGDLRRQKGLHDLLQAYARLPAQRPALVLIGRPCPDTPQTLPPGARILSNWPHTAVMQAWRRALLGLAPSIWPEPCATVILEAMASGKAVIATDIGGNPDMVEAGRTGLLVPPQDPAALARALQQLIEDPARRERMGRAGRERVKAFRAAAVVPRIESVYRQLIQARGEGRKSLPMEAAAAPARDSGGWR